MRTLIGFPLSPLNSAFQTEPVNRTTNAFCVLVLDESGRVEAGDPVLEPCSKSLDSHLFSEAWAAARLGASGATDLVEALRPESARDFKTPKRPKHDKS